jgi:hypothetical protein
VIYYLRTLKVPKVMRTEPERGEIRVPVEKKIKICFNLPMDTAMVGENTITFQPSFTDGFTVAWNGNLDEVEITPRDTAIYLKYSTKYTVTLSDGIKDTCGVKLDGNEDDMPGGDYKFFFTTQKPKFDLDKKMTFFNKGEIKTIKTLISNKEKRKLKLRIVYFGPVNYENSTWKHSLINFNEMPWAPDSCCRETIIEGKIKDTIKLMTVRNLGKKGCYSMSFNIYAIDIVSGKYLDTTIYNKKYDHICLDNGNSSGSASGPGGDQGIVITGGDDNWSISDPHYPASWLIDDEADVGLLLEGYSESCGHLLGRYGIATVPVESESLLVLSNMDRSLSDLKVLVIPTNGLRSMENWPYFWQRIEEYVSNGGYLIVLDQPYGNLYSRLPGSPQGRGFEEDLSCTGMFTLLQENNPAVYGQRFKQCQYPTDGYFTWLPPGATKHAIRLLRGGAASTITYPYGAGRLFATSCYIEQVL